MSAIFARVFLIVLLGGIISPARADDKFAPLPESPVAIFALPSCYGLPVRLDDFADAPLVVVAFIGVECPLARVYAQRLEALQTEFGGRVAVIGVDANRQDTPQELIRFGEKQKLTFPLLVDREHSVANQLGAERTPEVFLLDDERVIRYRGRVDDQYGIGFQRLNPLRRDLAEAIGELLRGEAVSVPVTSPAGCRIGRLENEQPRGDVTYYDHIAPILRRACVECHRPGQLAPFPLLTYEDTQGWEATIVEVVDEGRMPPWFASAKQGHFHNDRRLTDEEKDLIRTWVGNGAPAGKERTIAAPDFHGGLGIENPDQIIYLHDQPFQVPARGPLDYQYIEIQSGWYEDKFVSGAELRPGNPSVVHHMVVYAWAPDGDKQTVGVFAPGYPPAKLPPGYAQRFAAHSLLRAVIHYTPNGKPEEDRSSLCLTFTTGARTEHIVRNDRIVNYDFEIPARAASHCVLAEEILPRDVQLLSMMPHMHLRGSAFRYEAIYPNGTTEHLLEVANYDFNWQLNYELSQPKTLPQGTRIRCTATYNNSADNPANPDPDAAVRFGLRTEDEMMFGLYQTAYPRLKRPPELDYKAALSDTWLSPRTVAAVLIMTALAAFFVRRTVKARHARIN